MSLINRNNKAANNAKANKAFAIMFAWNTLGFLSDEKPN